jgi:translation initiation factor 3 subunit G
VVPDPALPPTTITFDPQTSIKTITTYHISALSTNRIRTIRKIRLSQAQARAERIALHLAWPKFGKSPPARKKGAKPTDTDNGEWVTRKGDDIPFYLGIDWRDKEKEWADEREKERIVGGIVCRNCAGSHFTAQCSLPTQEDQSKPEEPAISPTATPRKYVPPARRSGASSASGDPAEVEMETTSLRVSNIATTITETELADRFARFGRVARSFCSRDYRTGEYRGVGYVTFARREDAEQALAAMDRRGFDNLIMRVEWDVKNRAKKWRL